MIGQAMLVILGALLGSVATVAVTRANTRRDKRTEWYVRLLEELHFLSGKLQEYIHQFELGRETQAQVAMDEIKARYNALMSAMAQRNIYASDEDAAVLETFIKDINQLGALSNTLASMQVKNVQPTMSKALLKEVNAIAKRFATLAKRRF